MEKVAQKKRIEELAWRLAEELSAPERSDAKKRHREDVVAVKGKLTEQAKQLSVCEAELEGEIMSGKETVADLICKLKAPGKKARRMSRMNGMVRKHDCNSVNADRIRWVKAALALKIRSIELAQK